METPISWPQEKGGSFTKKQKEDHLPPAKGDPFRGCAAANSIREMVQMMKSNKGHQLLDPQERHPRWIQDRGSFWVIELEEGDHLVS